MYLIFHKPSNVSEELTEAEAIDKFGSERLGMILAGLDEEYEADDITEEMDTEYDPFRDDVEADADALASAGWGTDEDYGYYGDDFY